MRHLFYALLFLLEIEYSPLKNNFAAAVNLRQKSIYDRAEVAPTATKVEARRHAIFYEREALCFLHLMRGLARGGQLSAVGLSQLFTPGTALFQRLAGCCNNALRKGVMNLEDFSYVSRTDLTDSLEQLLPTLVAGIGGSLTPAQRYDEYASCMYFWFVELLAQCRGFNILKPPFDDVDEQFAMMPTFSTPNYIPRGHTIACPYPYLKRGKKTFWNDDDDDPPRKSPYFWDNPTEDPLSKLKRKLTKTVKENLPTIPTLPKIPPLIPDLSDKLVAPPPGKSNNNKGKTKGRKNPGTERHTGRMKYETDKTEEQFRGEMKYRPKSKSQSDKQSEQKKRRIVGKPPTPGAAQKRKKPPPLLGNESSETGTQGPGNNEKTRVEHFRGEMRYENQNRKQKPNNKNGRKSSGSAAGSAPQKKMPKGVKSKPSSPALTAPSALNGGGGGKNAGYKNTDSNNNSGYAPRSYSPPPGY